MGRKIMGMAMATLVIVMTLWLGILIGIECQLTGYIIAPVIVFCPPVILMWIGAVLFVSSIT